LGIAVLSYAERRSVAALSPYPECLWAVWDERPREGRQPERVVPDGCPELIVHLADPFSRLHETKWTRQPRVFLAGTLTRPWMLRPGRRVRTLGARFRPGAAAAFFDFPMDSAADREVALAHLVDQGKARRLMHRLARARGREAGWALVEAWLLERLQAGSGHASVAKPAVDLVLRARGRLRIDALADRLGWGRRRLERAFARDLGIGPKLFARIVRLNGVLATLGEAERARAVDLALDAGYFDQAHLLRDFRLLAGRRPLAAPEGDGEMSRHFTHPERLRTLFAGE
jgi:AraC-like DNA-binding protein